MKKFLAVGINHFARPGNDLNECVADAQTMAGVAQKLGVSDGIIVVEDTEAIKDNVLNRLGLMVKEAQMGALTYLGFSWSGHGTHANLPGGGLEDALVCYNLQELNGDWDPAGLITAAEFQGLINQTPPTCRVEVWFDTCFSQGMTRAFGMQPKSIHNPTNITGAMRVANSEIHHKLNSNVVVWCACSVAQESADAPNLGNGAFTYYWQQAWSKNPEASRIKVVTLTRSGIKLGGYDQVPRLAAWNEAAQAAVGA